MHRHVHRLTFSGVGGLIRDGRVASFSNPSTPFTNSGGASREQALANRRRNRLPVSPSPASNTIRARQTTFCGVFRAPDKPARG